MYVGGDVVVYAGAAVDTGCDVDGCAVLMLTFAINGYWRCC